MTGMRQLPNTRRPLCAWALVAACGAVVGLVAPDALAQERVKEFQKPPQQPQPAPAPVNGQPVRAPSPSGDEPPGAIESAGDEMVTLSAFTEAVSLASLVDMVASTLEINVATKGDVPGSVVFNAPVPVKRSELLNLLDQLLEQQGWTITKDRFGFYTVHPVGEVRPALDSERATTRVFSTPNIRPSSLKAAIEGQFVANPQMGGMSRQYTYIDELGIIVATDTPRRLAATDDIVKKIIDIYQDSEWVRLELTHIAAPVARERALQLVGQIAQPLRSGDPNQQLQQAVQQLGVQPGQVGALSNLSDRLTVDPQGNALFFRGQPDEVTGIRQLLTIIDRPNALVPKQYFAGSSAKQIADLARGQGLGEVTTIARADAANIYNFQQEGMLGQTRQTAIGGPVMVVDENSGNIIYYATPQQQERLAALIKELDTKAERIVLETYKLRSHDAEEVADILNALITNSQPLGTSPLLPGASPQPQPRRSFIQNADGSQSSYSEGGFGIDPDSFVIADISNNLVIVKARAGQQQEFARLIERLDKRKPQVYVEAMIVAVTTDDRLRLAFETQLINANGTGGLLNTNFGLGSFAASGAQPLLAAKTVASTLGGMTAAIIKSDQVPIIMTALANETDSRIVSSPQLLVDDNKEAEVVSIDEQPTTTISRGTSGSSDIVTAGESAEAGTKLKVKPQIADGASLRLEYDIELSSFTGEAQVVGGTQLPPPKQTNTIKSESITVPSDSTVVVGGLVVSQDTNTVAKIPLLGDIPLIGKLFSDTRTGDRKTRLYVFLTPRIIRDPNFEDLRLLSQGPHAASNLVREFPELRARSIDMVDASSGEPMPEIQPGEVLPEDQPLPPLDNTEPALPEARPVPPVRDSDKNEINPD